MKTRLLFVLWIGLSFMGCSVDPIEEELKGQIDEFNSEIEDYGCAGPDNSKTITFSEAQAIESWDEVRKLYLSLIATGVSRAGTFDPSIWNIINEFQNKGIGDYPTEYSLTGDCSDSVILTVSVIADSIISDPVCEGFSAGEDASIEIELSKAAAIESWDEVRKLYLSLLATGIPRNGTFDPSIRNLINQFNSGDNPIGEYTTTYTIIQGECSDSVVLTVIVVPDKMDEPICELSAGEDNLLEMKVSDAQALESKDEVTKKYLGLLEAGVPRNGAFDPRIMELISLFNSTTNPVGDYTTTYTITNGECFDSVELTIRVVAD